MYILGPIKWTKTVFKKIIALKWFSCVRSWQVVPKVWIMLMSPALPCLAGPTDGLSVSMAEFQGFWLDTGSQSTPHIGQFYSEYTYKAIKRAIDLGKKWQLRIFHFLSMYAIDRFIYCFSLKSLKVFEPKP